LVARIILAGFERYIYNAYRIAQRLHIPPCDDMTHFAPPDKAMQRIMLTLKNIPIQQPRYITLKHGTVTEQELASLSYPVVVKPVDGGGGLGIFLAHNFADVRTALARLHATANYDGEAFSGIIIEEYIRGTEYSVQGVARDGHSQILALCKKFIRTEPIEAENQTTLYSFREAGHIAIADDQANAATQQFSQACLDAFGYRNGPFHIDMIQTPDGYAFLEMGFRLSGNGLAKLVRLVSGYDWGEEVFSIFTGIRAAPPLQPDKALRFGGQITAASQRTLDIARQLQEQGYTIDIDLFPSLSVPIATRSLAADLSRHLDTKGRIIVRSSSMDEVERILELCSS
jgi:biotin carboxylase